MKKEHISAYLMALSILLMIGMLVFKFWILIIPVVIFHIIIAKRETPDLNVFYAGLIYFIVDAGIVGIIWGIWQLIKLI